MQGLPRLFTGLHLRPQRQALALEPRILFDGAAASAAADQHHSDPAEAAHPATDPAATPATPTEGRPATEQAPSPARAFLGPDTRIENREQLLAQPPANVTATGANVGEGGLPPISAHMSPSRTCVPAQSLYLAPPAQCTLRYSPPTSDLASNPG
ncbi:LEPR-XLL domain-containing protein, partial [Pseudomonas fluorescens]|uniref:LEPR-XLL domain-containing protein n=1 Tax=Pseudomonas fluorescens TaxID=294 RepID=UPI00124144C2